MPQKNIDIAKILFFAVVTGVVLLGAFSYGYYSYYSQNWIVRIVKRINADIAMVMEEKDNWAGIRPSHHLEPARHEGSGVTVNQTGDGSDDLILLSGFLDDDNENRLINRNGETVASWKLKYSELFPEASFREYKPGTDWNVDTHGALALPDGSVVFNFEYGGLVKLDRCNNVVWTLPLPSHHSVERAEGGGFWVPGRKYYGAGEPSPFPIFVTPFREDTLMKVDEDGTVIHEISVPQLFYDNGLEYLLTATGASMNPKRAWDREIVHLNKIAELQSDIADDFPLFEAGDLLLSLRMFNMILVVDPNTEVIKWWKVGPWIRQHDPEFVPGGKILVFNNNSYTTSFGNPLDIQGLPTRSNIIEIDPVTGQHRIVYGATDGQQFFTLIRGKLQFTPRGGLLITEFSAGRIFETDSNGQVIWEYINRYSENEVAELTEARVYDRSYFSVKDWSCEASTN